jgi:hypothetical protein
MKHKIMNTSTHVVKITNSKPFGSTGTWKESLIWEINIANADSDENDEEVIYYGTAYAQEKNLRIQWTELKGNQPLTEMIELCKYRMKQI